MNFLDRSGHIFNLPSYTYEPIGHEFEENDYIFWIDNCKMNKLSINNYYVRTIYLVVPFDRIPKYGQLDESDLTHEQLTEIVKNHPMINDDDDINTYTNYINDVVTHDEYKFSDVAKITITSQSNKFCLIRPSDIQNMTNGLTHISDYINYDLNKDNKLVTIDSDNDDLCAVIVTSEDEISIAKDNEDITNSLRKHNWSKENLAIVPIYVLSMSTDEGTWLSNLLIHIENKNDENGKSFESVDEDWCSITIGGEFNEENELLYINGRNMGIDLPKDMLRAIYQSSFINDEFNEELYNEKLKEYLMNFMQIKSECGNYNSVINSLKWFGYGDKMSISRLLRTDNEFKYQYIRDYFNINIDVLKSFNNFKNSTYIALTLKENNETGKYNEYDVKKTVYGEGTPELEDNFKKIIEKEYDYNNEKFTYLKPYYDFTFYEMGLKIACLKYYYKKYFLPLHLKIHSASIAHKVYTNDIKFNNEVYKTILSEHPILLGNMNENKKVLFEKSQVKYFIQSKRVVDEHFNEFYSYNENDSKDVYLIDDTCLSIPIKFVNDFEMIEPHYDCGCICHPKIKKEKPTYFNCVLLLEKEYYIKDTKNPYRMEFNVPINIFKDTLNVYNKDTKRKEDLNNYQLSFASLTDDGTKEWSQWINGIDELKEYLLNTSTFEIYGRDYEVDPELSQSENDKLRKLDEEVQIEVYTDVINKSELDGLHIPEIQQVCYALNCDNIIIDGKALSTILDGRIETETLTKMVTVYHNGSEQETINQEYCGIRIKDFAQEIITNDYYIRIPSVNDLHKNPINMYDISAEIIYIPNLYLKMKYDQTEIYDFKLNNVSYKNNVQINFVKETSLIYESHFNFVQNPNDPTTTYHSFILYPRMMNEKDINFFVNQEFKLKLLVNDQWYEYKFIAKMTDIDIQFGKLIYKYWSNDNKYISRFRQLSDETILDPNWEEGHDNQTHIHFNSFMYEPRLVEVNDVNYWHHLENYITKYNIISVGDVRNVEYVNGQPTELKTYYNCQYINYKGLKIFFNLENIKENYKENVDDENYAFLITTEEIEQAFDKDRLDPTILVINKLINFAKKQTFNYQHGWNNTKSLVFESLYKNMHCEWEDYIRQPNSIEDFARIAAEYTEPVYNEETQQIVDQHVDVEFYCDDTDEELDKRKEYYDSRKRYLYIIGNKFFYDPIKNVIYTNNNGEITNYQINEYNDYLDTLAPSSTKYFNNFITNINLPHNRKYLNNIQLYDIYEKTITHNNLFAWTKYTNLCCNGVLFYHSLVNKPIDTPLHYEKEGIDIVDDLYLENAIRISGTPLWDDDVYSNDLDLYANYANYDITTHSDVYDLQKNKYKLNEVLNYFDESNEYVFSEVRKVLNEKQIINNYRYFYYEDFTGKRYYTVENLNNIIEKLDKTYNTSNNTAHIQISDIFALYSAYKYSECEKTTNNLPLVPRAEQYSDNIALYHDLLYFTNNQNELDDYLDKYHQKLNFESITHVCDFYVDSLVELSSQNIKEMSFDGNNVIWDKDNHFTKDSTTIRRIIDKNTNLVYFIMTNYKRYIYRINDIKEVIDTEVNKIFNTEIIAGTPGLPLYYKLSYARLNNNGQYEQIDKSELTESEIHEIAIGNTCSNIKICVHLYYDMSKLTFLSECDRYGQEILIPNYVNSDDTIISTENDELKEVTETMQLSWSTAVINSIINQVTNKPIVPINDNAITPNNYKLKNYFKYIILTDSIIEMTTNDEGENESVNKSFACNILVNNVFDTVYINEHNNELVPSTQPGQYIFNVNIEQNGYDNETLDSVLKSLNNNAKIDGYEKQIINLGDKIINEDGEEHNISIDSIEEAESRLVEFNTHDYAREYLRNAFESNISDATIERVDDYDYEYENIYTIKTIKNESGKLWLDFELFFNPAYYSKLIDHNGNSLESTLLKDGKVITDNEIYTYDAKFEDIYHKDKNGNNIIWNYEYYSPRYLCDNTSIIYVIKRNGDKENIESGEIKYNHDYFDASTNTIELDKNDILYLYIKIKTNTDNVANKHGVKSRIRIPEFYIVPLVYKYNEEMTKVKYKKPVIDNKQYNLYEILLNDDKISSSDYSNFTKAFNDQNNKIYTEFFENTYLIRDENNSMYTMKDDNEVVTKEIYDIERLYDLEKQYNIWIQTNKLTETTDFEHAIYVTDNDNEGVYYDINVTNTHYTELDNLSTIEKNNLVNFAKYKYSIDKNGDFYKCKVYFNNSEIILNEYVYDKKYMKFISPKVNINMFLDYDMYLMHDDNYWYVIFISQDTINKIDNEAKLKVLDEQKTLLSCNSTSLTYEEREIVKANGNKVENDFYYNYTPYELRFVRSNNDFLINRMKFISSEGINQFEQDDIIAGNITNNDRLPINMIHSSKWKITPLSYGINFTKDVKSNTEMCILSYPEKNNTIESGYYDVSVRYSLDRNVSHQYTKKAKLKIK